MAKKRESISPWLVASVMRFGLGEGAQPVVVPGEGDRVGQSGAVVVCSMRVGPSQVKSTCSMTVAVRGEALFGDAAAERVVEVAPRRAVRGDH